MAIDISKLNQAYTKENSILTKMNAPGGLKDKVDGWEQDMHQWGKDFLLAKADYDFAAGRKDKVTMAQKDAEMRAIRAKVSALQPKLQRAKQVLSQQQQKVDAKVAELSQDPETKKKLDSILYKKYDRKRKVEEDKKKQLETIKSVADAHPTVKKWLAGIEGYNKAIKSCNTIIRKLSTKSPLTPQETARLAKAQADLPNAQANLAARKADLVAYFAKNHPEISQATLEGLHSYGDINRQMQGCDKTIANCTAAMSKLTVSKDLEDFTNASNNAPASSLTPAVTTQKPSWFLHPIKRFQYERSVRKANATPATPAPSKNAQRKSLRDEIKLSKDEYNADIVQKYLEGFDKGLHDAAKQNRGNGGSSR